MELFEFTPADEDDIPLILQLIRELAESERLSHAVTATEADLRQTLCGPQPYAEAWIARAGNEPVGFALFFHNYSTFLGRPGLYLEDLFIRPAHRRRGYGRRMLGRLAALARERGCGRMEWAALDWNEPAIRFYEGLGAVALDDWRLFRLTGEALETVSREARPKTRSATLSTR